MKQKIRKSITRIICYIMILSILMQNNMQTVYALPGEAGSAQTQTQETEAVDAVETDSDTEELQAEGEPAVILHEIEENRSEFSKEYLLSDNSRTMVVYPQQIHYEEDGNLIEIDNTLTKTEEGYTNGSNSFEVLITDNSESSGEVIFKEDEYQISWQMVELYEADEIPADDSTGTENREELTADDESDKDDRPTEEKAGKKNKKDKKDKKNKENKKDKPDRKSGKGRKTIHKPELEATLTDKTQDSPIYEDEEIYRAKQSSVTFDGYSNGVSVEYEPTGDGIKENIILTTRESGNEYIFNVQTEGLKARLNSNNEVEFFDETTDEIMYYFPAPFMIDSKGEVSYEARYELTGMEEELEGESESVSEPETVEETAEEKPAEEEAATDITEAEPSQDTVSGNETVSGNALTPVSANENIHVSESITVSGSDSVSGNDTAWGYDTVSGGDSLPENTTPDDTQETVETPDEEVTATEEEYSPEELPATEEPETTTADGICIKIILDEEWLSKASYPVTVDPVLKQARAKNLVDSGSIASDGTAYDTLYVGKKGTNIYRSFVKFELPEMDKQSVVSEALLYLNGTVDTENTHYIQAHMAEDDWYNTKEITGAKKLAWDTQPELGSLLDYAVNASYFNITKAVRKWMSGEEENFGIAFTAYDETKATRDTIRLRNSATAPYLKVTYRTMVGLESYWGTHGTGAGSAGAGYVNDYTGALTVVNTGVVTAGNRFPLSISHVYNSNDTEEGNGWRLNYDQTIKIPLNTVDINTYPYVYTDEDGTEHYFKKAEVTYLLNGASKTVETSASIPPAKDEDGLGLFIVPVSDADLKTKYPLKLIDKSSSVVKYFDTFGRLAMITDSNQYENGKNSDTKEKNAVTITYENYGNPVSFQAYDDGIAAAQAFRDICYKSGVAVGSDEYTAARDKAVSTINTLKKDIYATSDYKTAKQVNTAAVNMAALTDATGTITKATAKTKSDAILTALKKAKTLAEPYSADSTKRIKYVADAVGNKAVFVYNSNGTISSISDPTYEGLKKNSYRYKNGNLTQITFASGKNAYYTYAEGHQMTSQQDNDGYRVDYTYSESDGRIVKVAESHTGTPGQTYGITYNTDNTNEFRFSGVDDVYKTNDDIINVHVFDEQGRAVCIYSKAVNEDKILGATACTYQAESSDDTSKRNKIKDTAVVGMHTNNLLKNHSFEYDDTSWTIYENGKDTTTCTYMNDYSTARYYLGSHSANTNMSKRLNGVGGFKQEAELTAGTYTLSAYCKTVSLKNTKAYLKVTDASGKAYYSNKITAETDVEFDNGWQRLEVTFTLKKDQTVTVYLENDCGDTKGAGYVTFDCVQLEAGNVANDYNMLEDGSFELTEETLPYKWKNLDNSTIKVKDERISGGVDGDYCYHITGQPGKDKYLRVNVNLGSAKNSYVLSGWVKSDTTPVRSGRSFKAYAYHKEETEEAVTELKVSGPINAYSEGWKYFCMIIPAANWKSTSITLQFYDNIGDLYIDGLQLTRNDVQTKKYNSSGKLISSYTSQKSTSYEYDTYGRMDKQTTPSGASMSYTYSKTNDVTRIAASIGPDEYMTYDKYGNKLSSSSYDPDASTKLEIYTETSYTEDGNFDKTSTDAAGNVTSYEYNTLTGQLAKTILPVREGVDTKAVTTHYIYDEEDRISEVSQGERSIGYEYGEFDDLTGINHNGFSYNYTYDKFGNVLTASIAGNIICTNVYAPNNGGHVKTIYPDGTYTGTTYDEYGKVTSNSLDGNTITRYVYDNDGNVAKKTDELGDITTKFDYNDSGLLVRSEVYKGDSTASENFESRMQYTYTKSGKVGNLSYQEKDSEVRTYVYTYATDDKPTKSLLPDKSYTNWYYDTLRRNNKIIHTPKDGATDGKKLYTVLDYLGVELTTADGKTKKATTGLISSYTNKFGKSGSPVSKYNYTYDEWGNITKIEETVAGTTRTYAYNEFSEVTKAEETYKDGNKYTYSYVYDNGGNILKETVNGTVHTYKYDSEWKDKLISYDGKAITYDQFGCPINYMDKTLDWDIYGGLTSVKDGSNTITYTYMGDGDRRSKTVNGVTTTYHYNHGMLLSETTGDETLRYYYDSTGKVAAVVYKKGEGEERSYFYERNVQGDITAIYRSSDSALIGTYEYDLWGKLISAKEAKAGIDTDGILTKNPFRYRGYYYDNETGFYYLNARYYDPEIRRFISSDSLSVLMIATVSLDCKNLFAYSENNPVMCKDSTGNVVETVFDLISLGQSIVEVLANPTNPWNWMCLIGDVADLVPCVTGVGEIIRGLKVSVKGLAKAKKASNVVEAGVDAAQVVNKIEKISDVEIIMPKKPHTNRTSGHWETILDEVESMKNSGDYSKIYVNKGLSNEVPGARPNRRPDIMGVRYNGLIDQVEVPSKTDSLLALRNRMIDNQRIIGSRAGNIKIRRIQH